MSQQKIVIGVSGVAQSGKDTFFYLFSRFLRENHNLVSKRYALADYLKLECKDFLYDNFGLDVWSNDPAIKKMFRPLLIWFGDIKREQTKGKYFTDITYAEMMCDTVDVAFVTDIRYGELEDDEIDWVQCQLNGKLVHIQRIDTNNNVILPANANEQRNDPILRSRCDYSLQWTSEITNSSNEFLDEMYVRWYPELQKTYSVLFTSR